MSDTKPSSEHARREAAPGSTDPARDGRRERARRAAIAIGLVALLASAAYGGDLFGVRTRLSGSGPTTLQTPAVGREAGAATETGTPPSPTRIRSQPWWQEVGTFDGEGDGATPRFTIAESALQWRVDWTCETGALEVAGPGGPLLDGDCPEGEPAYGLETGALRLDVETAGSWRLTVRQQVDVPLVEDPLPQMQAADAREVTDGTFYGIDQSGQGRLIVYRLPGGAHALRLEEFFVTPNVDLELHLSPLERPESTEEFRSRESTKIADLDVTAGSLNFRLPESVDPTSFRSLVVWCPPLHSAYAAAPLATTPGS